MWILAAFWQCFGRNFPQFCFHLWTSFSITNIDTVFNNSSNYFFILSVFSHFLARFLIYWSTIGKLLHILHIFFALIDYSFESITTIRFINYYYNLVFISNWYCIFLVGKSSINYNFFVEFSKLEILHLIVQIPFVIFPPLFYLTYFLFACKLNHVFRLHFTLKSQFHWLNKIIHRKFAKILNLNFSSHFHCINFTFRQFLAKNSDIFAYLSAKVIRNVVNVILIVIGIGFFQPYFDSFRHYSPFNKYFDIFSE